MAKLVVMVGLPGSGKSYYANKLYQEAVSPTVILSSDDYRKRLFGDENDQEHNDQVFKALYAEKGNNLRADSTLPGCSPFIVSRKFVQSDLSWSL